MTAVSVSAPSVSAIPEGRLVTALDRQLYVIETGDPDGAPLVFLHGGGPGGTSWTDFGPVVPYFSDRRIVLVDMLMFGQSSSDPIVGPTWSTQAGYIAAALDQVGVEGADFVCSSMGGSAALALAALHPRLVRKLVVDGCQPMMRAAVAPSPEQAIFNGQAWTKMYADEGPTLEKMRGLMADLEWYDADRIPEETVAMRLKNALLPGPMSMGASREVFGEREDIEPLLVRIAARVLFFWGMQDPFLVPEYALALARTVPYGDVYIMNEASHHPEEERPQDVSRIVRAFLEQPADRNE